MRGIENYLFLCLVINHFIYFYNYYLIFIANRVKKKSQKNNFLLKKSALKVISYRVTNILATFSNNHLFATEEASE